MNNQIQEPWELPEWQKRRNENWDKALTREVQNRILQASNDKRLFEIKEDDIAFHDRVLLNLAHQDPHYVVQLFRETREMVLNLMEERDKLNE